MFFAQFKIVYMNKLTTSPKQLYLLSISILNMDEETIKSSRERTHLRFVPGGQGWRCKIRERSGRKSQRWGKETLWASKGGGRACFLVIGLENLGETAW